MMSNVLPTQIAKSPDSIRFTVRKLRLRENNNNETEVCLESLWLKSERSEGQSIQSQETLWKVLNMWFLDSQAAQ